MVSTIIRSAFNSTTAHFFQSLFSHPLSFPYPFSLLYSHSFIASLVTFITPRIAAFQMIHASILSFQLSLYFSTSLSSFQPSISPSLNLNVLFSSVQLFQVNCFTPEGAYRQMSHFVRNYISNNKSINQHWTKQIINEWQMNYVYRTKRIKQAKNFSNYDQRYWGIGWEKLISLLRISPLISPSASLQSSERRTVMWNVLFNCKN